MADRQQALDPTIDENAVAHFAALAAEVGLLVAKDDKLGWSASTLVESTQDRYAAEVYRLEADDLYLVGTSEVPLAGYHSGEILDEGHILCIDTYCYGGKWLTALDVGSGRVWQAGPDGKLRD